MKLFTLLRGELTKMYRQRGTYAGYILLALFTGLFVWGMWAEQYDRQVTRHFSDEMAVGGQLMSGPLIAYLVLEIPVATGVFIPLLISMIAGGIITGEVQRGTLRTMLTRPVHRWAVVSGKVTAAFIHAATLVLALGALSLIAGYAVFPGGTDIVTYDGGLRIIAGTQALARLAIAYGVTTAMMCAVAAIAVLCSAIFGHPLTASGVMLGFLIVSGALMVIPYFEWLKPYLITNYFRAFKGAFETPIDWSTMGNALRWAGIYTAVAIAATLAVFCRKDVTC